MKEKKMKNTRCNRCKRRLKNSKSIDRGYGPSCFKKIGRNRQKRLGDYNGK